MAPGEYPPASRHTQRAQKWLQSGVPRELSKCHPAKTSHAGSAAERRPTLAKQNEGNHNFLRRSKSEYGQVEPLQVTVRIGGSVRLSRAAPRDPARTRTRTNNTAEHQRIFSVLRVIAAHFCFFFKITGEIPNFLWGIEGGFFHRPHCRRFLSVTATCGAHLIASTRGPPIPHPPCPKQGPEGRWGRRDCARSLFCLSWGT